MKSVKRRLPTKQMPVESRFVAVCSPASAAIARTASCADRHTQRPWTKERCKRHAEWTCANAVDCEKRFTALVHARSNDSCRGGGCS
eukprot:6213414-Pleurochrysis_carterae.AAC.3